MNAAGYVAPAARVYTVAHIPGPVGGAVRKTVCGLEMDASGCWLAVELEPGEKVCRRCEYPSETGAGDQGSLL